ncbi:unnamed protein product [Parascedosporium putredinis]|uniref:D-aminoacyl-tRNA deacylase n=1 Tax=Parascedosporium putredinis TaxID=1442378 RepID=A0A9P1M6M3_9PEZI|nr:unnamed protein product [Parascedosporium putredinis]CAI7989999.1 unnamed protein product [Parascedosporium putredinis]
MKAVIQRVLSASVTVDKEVVSSIGKGILVFAAVGVGDTEKEADYLANKVLRLKFWDGDNGATWRKNVTDIEGEILCVSQFTLLAKTSKGNKPDFHLAAPGEDARRLYHYFLEKVKAGYVAERVKDGKFQAMMEVALVNDGPVTLEVVAQPKGLEEPQ